MYIKETIPPENIERTHVDNIGIIKVEKESCSSIPGVDKMEEKKNLYHCFESYAVGFDEVRNCVKVLRKDKKNKNNIL